ncbi:hypothetical protein DEO72_LG4g53 [Vigna unguiculata]|uniref:Uncharacterized protein n=1 Tax=Vigna unguiculata TaxID=3917 RepID=A0A4D6LLB8_VIGUN|nr:hypothetical protein DEO72_LG4g53 [Vigna unguiculata]
MEEVVKKLFKERNTHTNILMDLGSKVSLLLLTFYTTCDRGYDGDSATELARRRPRDVAGATETAQRSWRDEDRCNGGYGMA